eukprot:9024500-Heterocapsa_arctica.AAC.1
MGIACEHRGIPRVRARQLRPEDDSILLRRRRDAVCVRSASPRHEAGARTLRSRGLNCKRPLALRQ